MKLRIIALSFLLLVKCDLPKQKRVKKTSFISGKENKIISNMNCWESSPSENTMTIILFTKDEKEKDKYWEKYHNERKDANLNGIKNIKNDTIFISSIRSDSTYNSFILKRKKLAKKLKSYRNELPNFKSDLLKISNKVIEYKYHYFNQVFGIYESVINQETSILKTKKFFNNYSERLKQYYVLSKKNINDKTLIEINNLLTQIENIDRHIWAVPYYKKSMTRIEEKIKKDNKLKKADELFNSNQ